MLLARPHLLGSDINSARMGRHGHDHHVCSFAVALRKAPDTVSIQGLPRDDPTPLYWPSKISFFTWNGIGPCSLIHAWFF